jgi:hypothetical protein
MTAHTLDAKSSPQRLPTAIESLRTSEETATFLNVSVSWLAKSRMRGDGPPFILIGRCVRYSNAALPCWLKSHER